MPRIVCVCLAMAGTLSVLCAKSRAADNQVWPQPTWKTATPADVGLNESLLRQARDYALTGGGSGYITRSGRLVMSWGLYDSLIVVIPSLDIVVARAGQSWKRNSAGHYDVLQPFLGPITASVGPSRK